VSFVNMCAAHEFLNFNALYFSVFLDENSVYGKCGKLRRPSHIFQQTQTTIVG
jgi:hypothetical protein